MLTPRSALPPPLAVLAACAAAGDPTPPEIVFSPCEPVLLEPSGEVLPEEWDSVADAATMWNQVAGTRIGLEDAPGAQRIPIWFEEAAPFSYGVYRHQIGDVVINRKLRDREARAIVVAHELGHAFGLFHVSKKQRPSLMNPGNLTVAATPADADALDALWGCLQAG